MAKIAVKFFLLLPSVYRFANCKRVDAQQKPSLKILVILGNKFPVTSHTFILNQIKGLMDGGHRLTLHTKQLMLERNDQGFLEMIEQYDLMNKIIVGPTPVHLSQYDVILCQFGMLGARLAKLRQRHKFKAKLVTCFRGADLSVQVKHNKHSYDTLFKYGDYFLPVCDYFKNRLISLGCQSKKIGVMYSGVELDKFTYKRRIFPEKGSINITSISRLVPKKGISDAVRAVVYAHKQFPNIRYKIIGDGKRQEYLQKLINDLQAQNYITLVGRLPHDTVCKELDSTHVFILPSKTAFNGDQEGIPNAVKEAMLCGIPVLTTRHSGIPELVENGVTGYLVPERHPRLLGEKLVEILGDPGKWEMIGLAASKKIVDMFDNKVIGQRLESRLIDLVRSDPKVAHSASIKKPPKKIKKQRPKERLQLRKPLTNYRFNIKKQERC